MGTENEGEGNAPSASDPKKDALYEDRPTSKKIIRVVTVVAYMVSVSFVAIVLSGYYVFLWQPPNPRLLHRDHLKADPQVEYFVDKPPMEVVINESLGPDEIREKVNSFREEILRTRGVNISFQAHLESLEMKTNNSKVSQVEHVIRNETRHNNSQTQLNPIVRTLLGTTEDPTSQITLRRSTDVYESLNDAMKSSTAMDSLLGSTVFIETEEINGSSSTTRLSSSSSSSSFSSSSSSPSSSSTTTSGSDSSSLLPESRDQLYNASVIDIVSTTATAFVTGDSKKLTSNTGPIKRIIPTRAYELLESLGNTKAAFAYTGSSGVDRGIDDTKIRIPGIVEKNAEENVSSFGESKGSQFSKILEKAITKSGHPQEQLPGDLESATLSNIMGSHITRLSSQLSTNNTEPNEKLSTNFPPEKEMPIEIVPDSAEELEPVLNSAASVVPAVVQPDPEFTGKKQQLNEQLTQDGDFAFI